MASRAKVPRGPGVARARGAQVEQMQRLRLIAGAARAIDELGYTQATVGRIAERAGVSRRTFYEIVADREECLVAVIDSAVTAVAAELASQDLAGRAWRERIRLGLAGILTFLDNEPALARVCVVHALQAGPRVQRRREGVLAGLAAVVDEGRREGQRGESYTPLTAEGLVGATFGILYTRLQRDERQPLTGLLSELVAMIVLPYLGPATARRELARPAPAAPRGKPSGTHADAANPLRGLGMRLTYRTALVLEGVQRHPGVSNRLVAEHAGVLDPAQISRLLSRLERAGLLSNTSGGHTKGEPNAWHLTSRGEQVTQSIGGHAALETRAA